MYNFGRRENTTLKRNSVLRNIVESCYTRAKEFLPQRWLDQPHMVKNKNVYQPFSKGKLISYSLEQAKKRCAGRYGCPGRGLAFREIRLLMSTLVPRYNIILAEGENGLAILDDMRDNYVLSPGKIRLSFLPRSSRFD